MAAPITIHARAGETLDAVVNRALARTAGVVEQVLAANPDAAAFTRLPEGMAITIPADAQVAPIADLIDLWS